ncbi:MAG: metallophosphoesterase, partial [Acidobacteria bacterium]|nr:metallophosphoesterase [Candidatus Polarisedimenticola svalbardensis]
MMRTGQRWSLILAVVVLLTLPCGAGKDEGSPPYRWDGVERVVALGDVHGALDALVSVLQSTGLADPALHWSGGRTHLVSLGDLTDRGPDSREVMDLLIRLQPEAEVAGGRVHVLLSNHEVMGAAGDLRYTTREDFATWKDLEDAGMRDRAWSRFRTRAEGAALKQRGAKKLFEELFPPGFFGRTAAFSSSGRYGRWIRDLPAVIVINRTAFVHAGISAESAKLTGEELNRLHSDALGALMEDRESLIRNGTLAPETAFAFQTSALFEKLEESVPEIRRIGFRYLELLNSILFRP